MAGELTDKNVIQHEFIGLNIEIVATPCKSLEKVAGEVVDETMNTFKVEYVNQGRKTVITIPKHGTRFRFTLPENNNIHERTIIIDGSVLTKRPEDRIKKLAKLSQKLKKLNKNSSINLISSTPVDRTGGARVRLSN